jgi:hypothetical protein
MRRKRDHAEADHQEVDPREVDPPKADLAVIQEAVLPSRNVLNVTAVPVRAPVLTKLFGVNVGTRFSVFDFM